MGCSIPNLVRLFCLLLLLVAIILLAVGITKQHYPLLTAGCLTSIAAFGILLFQCCSGDDGAGRMTHSYESEFISKVMGGAMIATVASLSAGPPRKTESEDDEEDWLEESDRKKNRTNEIIH